MTSAEPAASLERVAAAVAEAHNNTLTIRRHHGSIRILHRDLEQHIGRILADLQEGDPGRIRELPYNQWLLDNGHVLRATLQQIKSALPGKYYRQLPTVVDSAGKSGRQPRVASLVSKALEASELPVDLSQFERFCAAYQTKAFLNIGELWALPTMLRISLMQKICYSAEEASRLSQSDLQSDAIEELTTLIAGCITSLRNITAYQWQPFIERISHVDAILQHDPAALYAAMDFDTRDDYRDAVERVSRSCNLPEWDIADAARQLAQNALTEGKHARRHHVGYFLVDKGRRELYRFLHIRQSLARRILNAPTLRRDMAYVSSLLFGAVAICALMAVWLKSYSVPLGVLLPAIILAVFPALSVSSGVINNLLSHLRSPRRLPKLDFSRGIPKAHRTVVAVPAMLSSQASIDETLHTMELNYLGNSDPELQFVLLTDYVDASVASTADDQILLEYAKSAVDRLNDKYSTSNDTPFVLLHRQRRWNVIAGLWMGWERKRGKLVEFNDLLRGSDDTDYTTQHGVLKIADEIRYVITLDADTRLPAGNAVRLIGTLAHPLNRPVLNERTGEIDHGYSIIQPRLETNPTTSAVSAFARVFSGDVTLDLYTHAVSDIYQDLFAEGIFAGKGIYDVDAFRASVHGCIPDNRVLSHDLLEGLYGRAGLASDVLMLEDYPTSLLAHLKRVHRWIRGDWQLLPWVFGHMPGVTGRRFSPGLVGRWKLFDNLRRSLLAPAIVVLLTLGWLILPVNPWIWTVIVAITPGLGVILHALAAFRVNTWRWGTARSSLRNILDTAGNELARWILMLAFLPIEAFVVLDAVGRTLYRLRFSHRDLLEWSTAAEVARELTSSGKETHFWKRMWPNPAWAGLNALAILLIQPSSGAAATILLLLWAISPSIAFRISRVERQGRSMLGAEDQAYLRRVARQTWRFFEQYVGPDTHWLPPDNVQFEPVPHVAQQTSPTNIGFALLSTVAANDLGYTGLRETVYNLHHSLQSVVRLQKYRGHLYNWYSLEDCRPLTPRYVSTVDSGNLLGALIVVRESLLELAHSEISPNSAIDGIRDDLALMQEMLARLSTNSGVDSTANLLVAIHSIEADIRRCDDPEITIGRLAQVHTETLNRALLETIVDESIAWTSEEIEELRSLVHSFSHRSASAVAGAQEIYAWSEELASLEQTDMNDDSESHIEKARRELTATKTLSALPQHIENADEHLQACLDSMSDSDRSQRALPGNIGRLRAEMARALDNIRSELDMIRDLIVIVDKLVANMDFRFLYDDNRHLFHVGYRADSGELDTSYYDLLASEARLASFVAIAKGDAPPKHWMHLGRPLTSIKGLRVLLSWSATSFEYLMPRLLMRTPRFGLLNQSCRGAIKQQRRFGHEYHIPWGVSESGYHHFDQHGRYQYQAFGIPRLGLKWDQGERLVISSYSSMLALPYKPAEVVQNSRDIEKLGGWGEYGLYEALDFGAAEHQHRVSPKVVQSYMAHHQGMSLVAITNCLMNDKMVERFHRDPGIASVEYLLHEQLPRRAKTQALETFDAPLKQAQPFSAAMESWTCEPGDKSVAVLANQRLSSRITTFGGGNIRWRGHTITRWLPHVDGANGGALIYLKDLERNVLWSPSLQSGEGAVSVICRPDYIEFRNTQHSLLVRQQVLVAPYFDVEIRKLSITNDGDRPRRLMICAYSEPVLTDAENDARHPAFSKLFLEDEYLEGRRTLVYRRRTRDPDEPSLVMANKVVASTGYAKEFVFETDRGEFLGRNGDRAAPLALQAKRPILSCRSGVSLDPVSVIAITIDIPSRQTVQCAFLSAAGDDETQVLRDIDRLESLQQINWTIDEARRHGEHNLIHLEVTSADVRRCFDLLGATLMPPRPEVERADRMSDVRQAQRYLWRHGISGDRPLITVAMSDPGHLSDIESLVNALSVCQARGMVADIVFIDESNTGYAHPTQDRLRKLIDRILRRTAGARQFSTYILPAYSLDIGERSAISACSQLFLDLRNGHWIQQLQRLQRGDTPIPAFLPQPSAPVRRIPISATSRPADVVLSNGLGGMSPDDYDYNIYLDKDHHTPAPWCNILANAQFGTLISESGSAFSWYQNSGEYALTPWSNDPTLDRTGEALYIRDEETGLFWSPMPGPARDDQAYSIRHKIGSSVFDHNSEGLEQSVTVFVDATEPVKYICLNLKNRWRRTRRLTVTYAAEWRLGNIARNAGIHLVPDWDEENSVLYVRNSFSSKSIDASAFLTSNLPAHGVTCDGTEFLGSRRSWRMPAGLRAIGLSHYVGPCALPMAAYQVHVSLAEGESCQLHFALGSGKDRDDAAAIAIKARSQSQPVTSLHAQQDAWTELIGSWQVKTPDGTLNALLNRWLPYQIISSRLWGRLGFYQASGGFGFRDQLQDVLALLNLQPALAASQIVAAAGVQFEEGDVLHWWHLNPMRGVRTRCSDDLLWLPYVVSQYINVTRDYSILDEQVPFLSAAPLSEDETERYAEYLPGSDIDSIYEHCCRAIECRMRLGQHGLPLIGTGDWNDGFSRVGIEGTGESVWLAWFLIEVCRKFEPLCKRREDIRRADAFRQLRTELNKNIEASAWTGDWYLRGFYDDGSTLGGPDNAECRIDLNAQTWAVIAGGDSQRNEAAMKAVREQLIDDEHRLIKLLTPPFHSSDQDPGYIKSYPPGVRENGGQYNHAAAWAVLAAAESGDADLAFQWLSWLNPLTRSSNHEDCKLYRIEPYVVAGDIYGCPPFTGRGGWSWYSGSAAWFYRVAMENLLGIQRRGNRLRIRPCLPESWSDYEVSINFAAAKYQLRIHKPSRINDERIVFVEDGQVLSGTSLKLQTNGDHDIQVFPDNASWQRWRSANSGKTAVSVRNQVAGG